MQTSQTKKNCKTWNTTEKEFVPEWKANTNYKYKFTRYFIDNSFFVCGLHWFVSVINIGQSSLAWMQNFNGRIWNDNKTWNERNLCLNEKKIAQTIEIISWDIS